MGFAGRKKKVLWSVSLCWFWSFKARCYPGNCMEAQYYGFCHAVFHSSHEGILDKELDASESLRKGRTSYSNATYCLWSAPVDAESRTQCCSPSTGSFRLWLLTLHHPTGSHSLTLGTACEMESWSVVTYFHTETSSLPTSQFITGKTGACSHNLYFMKDYFLFLTINSDHLC